MDGRFRDRMRQERANEILKETASLAGESGWDGFRVEDVALRVGVAKGTIYLDFPDKDRLLAAALSRCAREFLRELRAVVEPVAGAGERLVRGIEFLTSLPVEHPDLAAIVRSSAGLPEGTLQDSENYVLELVRAAQAAGVMPESLDPELAAQVVFRASSSPAVARLAVSRGPGEALSQITTLIGSLPTP